MTRRLAAGFAIALVSALAVPGPAYAAGDAEQAKLTASDAAAVDLFGNSVAVSGDTAVVGAYGDDHVAGDAGSAYVFTRSGTTWTQQAKLTASDAAGGDVFGISVAVSGDTAVVGAYLDDHVAGNAGSAYVFTRSGTLWTQQAKLTASDAAADDLFGYSVAVSGDTAVVGAYLDDHVAGNAGSAYVFTRSGTSWTQQAKLTASDAAAVDNFGVSVAVSGDTAVVGAFLDDHVSGDAGSTYVFTRSGTSWTQQAKLTASDAATGHRFGLSVAVSGDTAVVGAYRDNHVGTDAGSAYVFTRSGTSWTQQTKLTASDAAASDYFGWSVAVSGGMAVVGAYRDDHVGTDAGSAYVFTRSGASWTQKPKLTASDAAAFDYFGVSVAVSGGTAVVGAYLDDHVATNAGSAYVFVPDVTPPATTIDAPLAPVVLATSGRVLTGTATDDRSGVAEVLVTLTGATGTRTLGATCVSGCTSGTSITWRLDAAIGRGTFVTTAHSTDRAGNTGTETSPVLVVVV